MNLKYPENQDWFIISPLSFHTFILISISIEYFNFRLCAMRTFWTFAIPRKYQYVCFVLSVRISARKICIFHLSNCVTEDCTCFLIDHLPPEVVIQKPFLHNAPNLRCPIIVAISVAYNTLIRSMLPSVWFVKYCIILIAFLAIYYNCNCFH